MTYEGLKAPPTEDAGAILYLGCNMVTCEMEEQIQYAAHSKQQFAYLRKKYEWTDRQLQAMNWRAIGPAKKRLKRDVSICTTKMMHEWLNVGTQKAYMKQEDFCSGCGIEPENQTHLYQCTHKDMVTIKEETLQEIQIQDNLQKAYVPHGVATAFLNTLHTITRSSCVKKTFACPEAWEAGEAQSLLGSLAILRGHHHVQWAVACMETFRRPLEPPTTRCKQIKKQYKSAFEISVYLIEQSWLLFEKKRGKGK